MAGQDDETAVLGERRREQAVVDDAQLERPRPRAPLLEPLGHRAGELREHAVRVPALAEPATRPADLALVAEDGGALCAGDREDDGRDQGWRAALPPFRPVDAAELREAAPGAAVEAERRAE